MITKALLGLLLLSWVAPAFGQTDAQREAAIKHATSARALLESCNLPKGEGLLVCESYFAGFQAASAAYQSLGNQKPLYCFVPRSITPFSTFLKSYLSKHPEFLDQRADAVVTHALIEEFPCRP
jgi:hypothetical protein